QPSPSASSSLPVPSSQPTPSATPTADEAVEEGAAQGTIEGAVPSPSATPGVPPCVARDVVVEPVTDQSSYSADQSPAFSIRLTNNGAACTLNVGTTVQAFTVSSG